MLTPSSYMVGVLMRRRACCSRSTTRSIPNRRHVDPDYLKIALDPEMHHSVPYMLANTGLAYLQEQGEGPRRLLGDASTAPTSRGA